MLRLLFLIALMLLPCLADASSREGIPTFTVGVQEFYYPPHSFMVNGEYSGYGRDVLDLFAAKRGYRFIYVAQPYIRNVMDLLGGKIDFQYPDNLNWVSDMKANHTILYSKGLVGYLDGVNRRREDLGKPLSELRGLVMPIGWTAKDYEPLAKSGQLTINKVATVEAVIAMLLKSRVDGAYLNADVVNYHFTSIGREGDVRIDTSLPYSFGYFSISTINHAEILDELDRFLTEQADDVAMLKQKYGFKYDRDPAAH